MLLCDILDDYGLLLKIKSLPKGIERVNNIKVNYKITDRRPGDIAACYADTTKAKEELGWEAKETLEDMCKDSWNFIKTQKEQDEL